MLGMVLMVLATGSCPRGATSESVEGVTACYDAEGKTHGPFVVTAKDGRVLERSSFVHGELDGRSQTFHPNGKKKAETQWKAGAPVGTHRYWYEDGTLLREEKHGAKGPEGTWTLNYPNGKLAWRRTFLGGKLSAEEVFDEQGAPAKDALPGPVLRAVVRSQLDAVRACYEKELRKSPTLAGKVKVAFTIGPEGIVTQAEYSGGNLRLDVSKCVVARMRKLQFPRPPQGGTVEVTYPWNFTPAGP